MFNDILYPCSKKQIVKHHVDVIPMGNDDYHYFFGYYDKTPWSVDSKQLLAMRNSFAWRDPKANEELELGFIACDRPGRFVPFGKTQAWNWQQGCMLRWLNDGRISYNQRLNDDSFANILYDPVSGSEERLPWAVYDFSQNMKVAATLNFERTSNCRPGYGYFDCVDKFASESAPSEDGIYLFDPTNSLPKREMVYSLAEALNVVSDKPSTGDMCWFNHILFNPLGTRFVFLFRSATELAPGHRGFKTRMFVMNVDGSNPKCIIENFGISHFDWYDDEHLLVWLWDYTQDAEEANGGYFMINIRNGEKRIFGEKYFNMDGHCSFSPDQKYMLTDTYPKGANNEQSLLLYDIDEDSCIEIAALRSNAPASDSCRCDLHPRWSRDGKMICVDSSHEDFRGIYILSIAKLINKNNKQKKEVLRCQQELQKKAISHSLNCSL